ncbi:MAG: manganese efflux pump MntP family protein [Rikenellaceae bacterium]|nr:manganese efflux pump MntP family protein [Rikenellaceae bacterium]
MTFAELLLIAIGLSMDAFAVSIGKGLSVQHLKPRHTLSVGLWFGGFQALMPLLGYAVASSFAGIVASFDHWIAFLLLAFIGAKMIREACSDDREECPTNDFTTRTMLLMAVATSIDAMAVGISFAFLGIDIASSAAIIGLTTCIFSMVGIRIGHHFGARYKSKAEVAGGIILILIGVKILAEHTLS